MLKRFVVAVLLACVFVRPAFGEDHNDSPGLVIGLGAMTGAMGSEWGATMFLLGQCNAAPSQCKVHEANYGPAYVIGKNPATASAIHAGVSFVIAYVVYRVHENHPKLASRFAWIAAGAFTGLTINNSRYIGGRQ